MDRSALLYGELAHVAFAKHKSRIKRIIPFAIIWSVFGILYALVEKATLIASPVYMGSGDPYDFRSAFIKTTLGTLFLGLVLGTLEVYLLSRLFANWRFWQKIAAKTILYVAAIIVAILTLLTIYFCRLLHLPPTDPVIIRINLIQFQAYPLWCVVIYMGVAATISLLFAEMSHHIGYGVLYNFFTGRYHTPKVEERIFMFLDMKSSTTIAEQMGHVKYFGLLKRYYADMTEAILASSGEICGYVGDEIVLSWTLGKGVRDSNCLKCFFGIKERLELEAPRYLKDFGRVPGFKAGLHCGHVTTGEIGAVRKDIVFTGDVMNTTARIQSLCNENGVDLLVSDTLMARLDAALYHVKEIGVRELKGKDEKVRLYTVWK